MTKRSRVRIVHLFLQMGSEFWIFGAGLLTGLWANLFTTRVLKDNYRVLQLTLELVLFGGSSALMFLTAILIRRIEINWANLGRNPGDLEHFSARILNRPLLSSALALLSALAGFLELLMWGRR